MSLEGAIAAHRFGLGARPGEIARASANPKAWLVDQLNGGAPQPPALPGGQPYANAGKLVSEEEDYKIEKLKAKGDKIARKAAKGKGEDAPPKDKGGGNLRKQTYLDEMSARLALGITTDKPFAERLVRFWSNHFTVSGAKKKTLLFIGDYEREAIRPYVNGSFEDMLFAACMHPAMQIYLDNWHSTGPNSAVGLKNSKKGLNENLGRELMELYTLGVDAGYTQADVVAMAKLLTGWGIYDGHANGFGFFPDHHEPGPITLRGKTYPAGWDGAVAAIKDLAHDPATARLIARKFATHFIADDPPKEFVARLEKVFTDTRGNCNALSVAWPCMRRGTPILRRCARRSRCDGGDASDRLERRGRTPGRTQGTDAADRLGADDGEGAVRGVVAQGLCRHRRCVERLRPGLLNRIQWAKEFGDGMPTDVNVGAMANDGLGPLLSANTKSVMAKASSKSEAVALLLSSPEFQRR